VARVTCGEASTRKVIKRRQLHASIRCRPKSSIGFWPTGTYVKKLEIILKKLMVKKQST